MTRLTVAQALIRFLAVQHSERDGTQQPLFAGCFGIFGHGNLAGIGQALHPCDPGMPLPIATQTRAYLNGCGLAVPPGLRR